ncbi:glutathione-dependent formaldehyde-activating enzyme [Roseovarius sp. A-2]|uniref:GFA family protein n=1 Tax=Roseovarius sp. A-2 TaxID=1570360 RepID=UPI0009D5C1F3|nr:GFA family protein [Roseovarius sp. A-2]GAW36005.1 glutathione-dependent formaldehyde-activating enzyme [Roseovarius sp. A-2]
MTQPLKATCHCGAVELRLRPRDPAFGDVHRCDCSFCRRRGPATVSVALADLEIVQGAEALTLYQWGTGTAKHYFCRICGIYTHHQRRSNPEEYGVNLGAIAGTNPREFDPIPWEDGVNHPSDT